MLDINNYELICRRRENYVLRYSEGIIKLTVCKAEYDFANFIINAEDAPASLPKIYKTEKYSNGYYAIWREELSDISDCCSPEQCWSWIPGIENLRRKELKWAKKDLVKLPKPIILARRDKVRKKLDKSTTHPHFLQLLELYRWLKACDIKLRDMGNKNWGYRDSIIVVRDLGGFSIISN